MTWSTPVAVLALTAVGCGRSGPSVRAASRSPPPTHSSPPKQVIARQLGSQVPGALRRGRPLHGSELGARVFADRRDGFALAMTVVGAAYPATTHDGGRTWHVDGPMLFSPPAGGPVAVDTPGLAGSRVYFAWLSDLGNVVDVTGDGGQHWWQTVLPGEVVSMVPSPIATKTQSVSTKGQSEITAIVAGPTSDPRGKGASLWEYRTRDGRRWSYMASINATP